MIEHIKKRQKIETDLSHPEGSVRIEKVITYDPKDSIDFYARKVEGEVYKDYRLELLKNLGTKKEV